MAIICQDNFEPPLVGASLRTGFRLFGGRFELLDASMVKRPDNCQTRLRPRREKVSLPPTLAFMGYTRRQASAAKDNLRLFFMRCLLLLVVVLSVGTSATPVLAEPRPKPASVYAVRKVHAQDIDHILFSFQRSQILVTQLQRPKSTHTTIAKHRAL